MSHAPITQKPIAYHAYQELADHYAAHLPTDEFRQADPQKYESLMQRPAFLCVQARRS
jgi:hypothetical protein